MLFKLALSGIKSKLKDYIVLLLGLVMSISIFYMFQTLAMNESFIKENSFISAVMFVFQAGSVLLAIITVAYCLYANSFLFSLRQKEFGMYMTLGAKKRKISVLMFIETMVIGLASLVIGIIIGIILSRIIGNILMDQLDFHSTTYQGFYIPSMLVTIIFFAILFLISAFANIFKLSRVTALQLIHGETVSDHVIIKKKALALKAIISLILLIIGYYNMINIENTQMRGIVIALITITAGTYLFFSTFLPFIIQKKRAQTVRKSKKINSFTYAQLNFRINQLSRVLATVAMLIALGVGAIAVGFAFKNNSTLMMEKSSEYDVSILNPTKEQTKIINSMSYTEKFTYQLKFTKSTVYFNAINLASQKPIVTAATPTDNFISKRLRAAPSVKNDDWNHFLGKIIMNNPAAADAKIVILSPQAFQKAPGEKQIVIKGMVKDVMNNLNTLKKLDQAEVLKHVGEKNYFNGSKYSIYESNRAIASGTVFMGFFLGFAFLTMMASCLMFKILTGATNDKRRYQMLEKLGVQRKLLTKSIYKEMFLTFLFPGIIGFIHVLLGMMMFSFLLINPYYKFYVPILLFLAIYTIYYFITVIMYKGIVFKKTT